MRSGRSVSVRFTPTVLSMKLGLDSAAAHIDHFGSVKQALAAAGF